MRKLFALFPVAAATAATAVTAVAAAADTNNVIAKYVLCCCMRGCVFVAFVWDNAKSEKLSKRRRGVPATFSAQI